RFESRSRVRAPCADGLRGGNGAEGDLRAGKVPGWGCSCQVRCQRSLRPPGGVPKPSGAAPRRTTAPPLPCFPSAPLFPPPRPAVRPHLTHTRTPPPPPPPPPRPPPHPPAPPRHTSAARRRTGAAPEPLSTPGGCRFLRSRRA